MKLTGRRAIVTGAARGIGRAIAERLCREGASVMIADVNVEQASSTAALLCEAGYRADAMAVDVTDPAAVGQLVEHAAAAFGGLDLLVNNAGVGLNRPFLQTTPEEWERTIRINLNGTFFCSQAAARWMASNGGGCIVNIASISGVRGAQNRSAYGASKAGVILLTKVMALELASSGIRVNAVAPGPVATDMTSVTHTAEIRATYNSRIPMKRYAEADEIASAVVFFASDDSSFVNGHTLHVDGGFVSSGLMFEESQAQQG
jgi:3-oxoacyl-[acyl-carrier protein] reductase